MHNETNISVIIPVYNVENYIKKCLDSILTQSIPNVEIICVNDGSDDKSGKILEEYSQKYKNIKIINQNNKGIAAARNTGLEIANGKYIQFIDSDDWLKDNALKEAFERAEKDNLDLVCFNVANYDNKTQEIVENQFYPPTFWPTDWNTAVYTYENYQNLFIGNFSVVNKLYKKSLLTNIKFIEGLAFEDHPFHLKTFLNAQRIGVINKSLYFYRKNVSTSFMGSIKKKNNVYDIFAIIKELKKILEEQNIYEQYRTMYLEYAISLPAEMFLNSTSVFQKPKFYSLIKQFLIELSKNEDELNAIYLSRQAVPFMEFSTYSWIICFLKYRLLQAGLNLMQKLKEIRD